MDRKLVCPCGLTCCDCMFYKHEIFETAKKLRDLIKANDLDKFLKGNSQDKNWKAISQHMMLNDERAWDEIGRNFDVFKDMPVFMSILEGLIESQCKRTCRETGGCSIFGITHECNVSLCINSKGYEGCWQCDKYIECEKLDFMKKNYGYVIEENLETAKEKGVESVISHGNKYYTWQRNNTSK